MLKTGFLRFCDNPEIACCKAEKELEQLRNENVALRAKLAESQRREQAAVEDIEKMMRICEKGACHFCANGDCTESPYCSPKWRGHQDEKGADHE